MQFWASGKFFCYPNNFFLSIEKAPREQFPRNRNPNLTTLRLDLIQSNAVLSTQPRCVICSASSDDAILHSDVITFARDLTLFANNYLLIISLNAHEFKCYTFTCLTFLTEDQHSERIVKS